MAMDGEMSTGQKVLEVIRELAPLNATFETVCYVLATYSHAYILQALAELTSDGKIEYRDGRYYECESDDGTVPAVRIRELLRSGRQMQMTDGCGNCRWIDSPKGQWISVEDVEGLLK